MEEYLKTLLEQVRCKKAHPYISEEIRAHMEDQTEANVASGMTQEEAMEEAVRDMGSPVEVGISLDRIHRPQMAWDMIVLMAIISLVGIVIHALSGSKSQDSSEFAIYTVIGFLTMLVIYRIDYSVIGKYAKFIALAFVGVLFVAIKMPSPKPWVFAFAMIYPIIYGAVIYQYHGSGITGMIKALLWMMIPTILIQKLPCFSAAIIVFFSMAIILSLAVYKEWFRISKKLFLPLFWGITALTPVAFVVVALRFHLLKAYQTARIKVFLGQSGDEDYISNYLRRTLLSSHFIGGSGKGSASDLYEFNNEFVLSYVTSSYGIAASVCICAILVLLTVKIFHITFKQKNQLGVMMGFACGMVFFTNVVLNVLQNTGLFPVMQTILPFFSAGGSNIIVCYAMIGIILSIYRYKNILPTHAKRCKTLN